VILGKGEESADAGESGRGTRAHAGENPPSSRGSGGAFRPGKPAAFWKFSAL
jgi:hypothetical protein